MRVTSFVLLSMLVSGCSGPETIGIDEPIVLPALDGYGEPPPRRPAAVAPAAETAREPVAVADSKSAAGIDLPRVVAPDGAAAGMLTELDVIAPVKVLKEQHGPDALRALPAGETLAQRLRYCYARMLLQEGTVLPELRQLATDHPDQAMVWDLLGRAQMGSGDREAAIVSLRRCYDSIRAAGFAAFPDYALYFGALLLQSPTTWEEGVVVLREELAGGAHFAPAGELLARLFMDHDRHLEALACVDAVIDRGGSTGELAIARARILLDCAQTEEVLAILEPLYETAVSPQVRAEAGLWLMRAYFFGGRFRAALTLVDRLLAATDLQDEQKAILGRERERIAAAAASGRRSRLGWECLAILRGGDDLAARIQILRVLGAHKESAVMLRAMRIAMADEEPALRAMALQQLAARCEQPLVELRAGLADPDATVRGMAARLLGQMSEQRLAARDLVAEFFPRESDPYAFEQMHAALNELTGAGIRLPFGAAADPARRAEVVAAWRQRR